MKGFVEMPKKIRKQVNLRISADLLQRIKSCAKAQQISQNEFITLALKRYVREVERRKKNGHLKG